MEAHPVPQNVTSFEFHLIGDMTIKQFIYLATGLAIAYFTFILIFPIAPVIAVPVIGISILLGVAFAFIPLYDRPFDHWVTAFIKAVYSPTQMLWQPPFGGGKVNPADPFFKNRLLIYLNQLSHPAVEQVTPPYIPPPSPPQPLIPAQLLTPLAKPVPQPAVQPPPTLFSFQPNQPPIAKPAEVPTARDLNQLVSLAKETQDLQFKIDEMQKRIAQLKFAAARANVNPEIYTEEAQKAVANLQNLVKQTQAVSTKTEGISTIPPRPKRSRVVVIKPPPKPQTQMILTSSPNVVNGIVTDALGNYLEGVIVIIHNQENMPVRALKTNKIGQFTGATPLPSGTYTLTLEKDNLEFDTLQITLSGEVMTSLKIAARRAGVANG